ncbi:MAG: leucine-rich repeat domain-containing protein, partial [Clostridia bacterium]|nr:leucine-rich repeat domain-containing protein [Clostridia bacterium]
MKNKNIIFFISIFVLVIAMFAVILTACNKEEEHIEHEYGEWETNIEATCSAEGLKSRVCMKCGHRDVEVLPEIPHTEAIDAAVPATCVHTGLTEGKHCSVCNKVLVEQQVVAIVPTAHTIVVDAAVAPTCTAAGLTEGSHCSACGAVIVAQDTIDELGHSPVVLAAKSPTCMETGLTEGSKCSRCNAVLEHQEVINALGHDFDEDFNCSICHEHREGFMFELVMFEQGHAVNADNYCVLCGTENAVEDFVFDETRATYSFRYNGPRTTLTLPASYKGVAVTTLGRAAFRDAGSYLVSIDITDNITNVSNLAFVGCSALKSVIIGHNVETIGDMAFMGCSSLESIVVVDGHPRYHSDGNCLIETATHKMIAGCKTSVIPSDGSVTEIGENVFNGNTSIITMSIPEGVTKIDNAAFYQCTNMTSVSIPNTVTEFGAHAFFYCSSLRDIYYYGGTKAEWKQIVKGGVWDMMSGNYIIHCKDGN